MPPVHAAHREKDARARRASVLPLIWQLDACLSGSARKGSAVGRVDVEGLHAGSGPDLAENRTPTMLGAYFGRPNEKGAISV